MTDTLRVVFGLAWAAFGLLVMRAAWRQCAVADAIEDQADESVTMELRRRMGHSNQNGR